MRRFMCDGYFDDVDDIAWYASLLIKRVVDRQSEKKRWKLN